MLVTTENGQELAGTFVLQGDNIASHSEEGYTVLMNTVLEDPVLADGKPIIPSDGAEQWLEALPKQYNGSYLRARLVDIPYAT